MSRILAEAQKASRQSRRAQPEVTLECVTEDNIGQVKRLNSSLFPVNYTATFYRSMLAPGRLGQIAVVDGKRVGIIACCKEACGHSEHKGSGCPPQGDGAMLDVYMMTLGVLAPYRRLGVGRRLLDTAIEYARSDPRVKRLVLHVQIGNDDALRFYQAHGFATVRLVENYYKRIAPPHAYFLEYRIR